MIFPYHSNDVIRHTVGIPIMMDVSSSSCVEWDYSVLCVLYHELTSTSNLL